MQRNILFGILVSSAIFTHAQDSLFTQKPFSESSDKQALENNIRYITFQKSLYETNVGQKNKETIYEPKITISEYTANELTSNWFINAAGGVSAFLGNPLGCEDLFGRTRPTFHISVGKWFNPTAGGRIAFQGFNLKNHLIEQQNYYHFHSDFLWNVTNLFQKDKLEARWSFIPFVGAGIIQNNTTHQHPFTLNYGILSQLHLTNHLSLSLELGGLTTFGDFDGAGKGNRFNDHLFHLSAGVSIAFGNKGWSYRTNRFNDLLTLNDNLDKANKQLEKENEQNSLIMAQMRNILEIEGLLSRLQIELEKSGLTLSRDSFSVNNMIHYPKNDYSGLNSLRKRLSSSTLNQNEHAPDSTSDTECPLSEDEKNRWSVMTGDTLTSLQDSLSSSLKNNTLENNRNYINNIVNRKICIGSPIFFFFNIGTANLTESSQLTNIDEIARICKQYDLALKVTGYADNATGDATGNSVLSNLRAQYITSELVKRSISIKVIKSEGKGGIDTYSPDKVNRCAKIELYLNH